jgi:L-ascorbate metabolism protein UlaG (beta-lactamase superfamily)
MEITYLGHSCFKISGKKGSVLTDPFSPEKVGIKLAKQDVDVVTVSHQHSDHNYLDAIKGDYLLLDSPGEYEVREAEFVGVGGYHDDKQGAERGKITMFSMEIDGIKIAHLSDLGTELTSAQLESLDGVDILFVPVGGKYTIDAETAVKVVNQVEPKIVIPMHYYLQGGKMTDLAPVTDFFKAMAVTPTAQDKLKVNLKDLPEELEVVYLKY